MALSQYVAINFLTKFDKKGLERATKELKGFDKFVASSNFKLRSFAKTGAIAAAAGLAIFAQKSISAALAQEKLDKQLRLTLRSIGKEGLLPDVKQFIDDLQRASNVSEEELVPALRQLVAQTGDLEASQFLLGKALDVSAGTGADLSTVLDAVNKAAIGNYKSIAQLGIGLTAADAKALGFAGIMKSLDKYTGAANASTQTFEGQLKSFKISAGEATETLGTGFLTAASYIVTGTDNLRAFGIQLESIAGGVSDTIVGFFKTVSEKGWLSALNTKFEDLGKTGYEVRRKQYLQDKGLLGLSQITIDMMEQQAAYGQKALTNDQLIAKLQAGILAKEKALTKEKAAQAALDKKKAELTAMFDLEKINLQAALSRKLTAEDELRVKILQKLADGTAVAVNEAQRYADILKVIEDGKITDTEIAALAKTWGITTTEVVLYISKLMTANDELRKMIGLAASVNVGGSGATSAAVNKYDEIQSRLTKQNIAMGIEPGAAAGLAASSARLQAQADAYFAAHPEIDPLTGARRVALADGGIVTAPTNALIGEAGAEAVIPLDKFGAMGTVVNVNVAGSVISEGQLQSVIQDALYNLNRTGAVSQLANLGR